MSPEQDAPVLSIEHWNYQMASAAGYPQVGEMGIFVDVAVFKSNGEIIKVQKVKELKIEWERFKKDEGYAAEVLRTAEQLLISSA